MGEQRTQDLSHIVRRHEHWNCKRVSNITTQIGINPGKTYLGLLLSTDELLPSWLSLAVALNFQSRAMKMWWPMVLKMRWRWSRGRWGRCVEAAAGSKNRYEVVARLVVLLHYDLPVKHPSPLPQHVEVQLRKHWGKRQTGSVTKCLKKNLNIH